MSAGVAATRVFRQVSIAADARRTRAWLLLVGALADHCAHVTASPPNGPARPPEAQSLPLRACRRRASAREPGERGRV